jgi:hypothetical protein
MQIKSIELNYFWGLKSESGGDLIIYDVVSFCLVLGDLGMA